MELHFTNLLIVMAVGFLAPLALGFVPRLLVPSVVLEIVLGIVLGPSVLGWVEVDQPVEVIDRVKARVIARKVFEMDSMFYQAMQIGFLESVGLDWRLKDQYLDAVKAVTAEEVRAVATKYLTDDRLTVAVLEPLPAPPTGRN